MHYLRLCQASTVRRWNTVSIYMSEFVPEPQDCKTLQPYSRHSCIAMLIQLTSRPGKVNATMLVDSRTFYCWLWVERIRKRQNFANAYPVSAYSTGCKTTDMVVRIHSTASFWKSSMLDEHGNPSPFPALVTDHRLIDQTLN